MRRGFGFGLSRSLRLPGMSIPMGPELVVNGADPITTTTGWTASTSVLTNGNGELRVSGTATGLGRADQSIAVEIGGTYQLSVAYTGGGSNRGVRVGTAAGGSQLVAASNVVSGYSTTFVATAATIWLGLLDLDPTTGGSNYAAFKGVSLRLINPPNLAAAYDFTNWTATTAGAIVNPTTFSTSAAGGVHKNLGMVNGKTYRIEFDWARTAGVATLGVYNAAGTTASQIGANQTAAAGHFDATFVAVGGNVYFRLSQANTGCIITSLSIKEVL